jgi:hypothetical protein
MQRTGGGIVHQSLTAIDESLAVLGTALASSRVQAHATGMCLDEPTGSPPHPMPPIKTPARGVVYWRELRHGFRGRTCVRPRGPKASPMQRTGGGIVHQSLTAIDESLAVLGTALASSRVQPKSSGLRLVEPERDLSSPSTSPNKKAPFGAVLFGGEGGIRTRGRLLTYARFPGV